jgi:hypothetical protein
MSQNVIAVDVRYKKPLEGLAGGTVTPGHLLEQSGGEFVVHSVEGGKAYLIADYLQEASIEDDYSSSDFMKLFPVQAGDVVRCILATSQTITKGDFLISAGDGTVKEAAASNTVTLGGSTNNIVFAPAGENPVAINFIDPSATSQSLSVDITGGRIDVSLKTGSGGAIESTPAEVETAIKAVSGYDDLVTIVSKTGTGAVEAGNGLLVPEQMFGYAEEDVTTTGTVKNIKVRKGA